MNEIPINEIDLFSSKLCVVDLNPAIDLNSLISECELVKSNDQGRNVSNRGGFQSGDIERNKYPQLDYLSELIVSSANAFISSKANVELVMPSRWLNFNQKYSYNTDHIHPGSLLSGTFYIQAPDRCGDLIFSRGDNLYNLLWNLVGFSSSPFFSTEHKVTPIAGMLVLFGSWETHRVEQNLSDEERISFSFNLVPKPL